MREWEGSCCESAGRIPLREWEGLVRPHTPVSPSRPSCPSLLPFPLPSGHRSDHSPSLPCFFPSPLLPRCSTPSPPPPLSGPSLRHRGRARHHPRKGAEMTEHGAGWTILYPFDPSSSGRLRDTSESDKGGRGGSSSADQQPLPCYQGSPLALMQLSPPYDRSQYLQRSGATLVYSLRTHRALKPAAFLLSPDVFYSSAPPSRADAAARGRRADARLVPCPLGRVESRSLQMQQAVGGSDSADHPRIPRGRGRQAGLQQHAPPPARGASRSSRPPRSPRRADCSSRCTRRISCARTSRRPWCRRPRRRRTGGK